MKKSKFISNNFIVLFLFITSHFTSVNAESLSNITETGKDFYLQKNIESLNSIIYILKVFFIEIISFYKSNNSKIIDIKYFGIGVMDIICFLLFIVLVVYLYKSKKSLGRVK